MIIIYLNSEVRNHKKCYIIIIIVCWAAENRQASKKTELLTAGKRRRFQRKPVDGTPIPQRLAVGAGFLQENGDG